MAFNVNTFLTRLGSAAIFSAVMLGCLMWNELAFILLFLVITFMCLREYTRIVEHILDTTFSRNEKTNFIGIGIASYLLVSSFSLGVCQNIINQYLNHLSFYFVGLLIGFLIMFFIFKRNKLAVYLLTGLGYIPLALGLLVQLRYQSILLPLILVLFIWMNDTMAYLTGSFIGKTPFFPAISPKKTIEGTIGGIIFTMLFAGIWGYFSGWFELYQWIIFGLIASLVGTIGDLIESKLKRMAGIKDSGAMMPGHGGALDRFDSLLLAAPFAFIFALIFMKCLEMKIF